MTAAPIDQAEETYHIELKPTPVDPLKRRTGIDRTPIYRLKRLLKHATRECGFRIRWGQITPPIELSERDESGGPMIRFTDGPAAGRMLILRRAPLFLRVVFNTITQKWDALDQLTDTTSAADVVYAYRRVGEASVGMVDWMEGSRRRGACLPIATYTLVIEQPDQFQLRDTAQWQAWCWAQVKVSPKAKPIGGNTT